MIIARNHSVPVFAFLALFLLGGCSGDGRAAASDPDLFRVNPNGAKLFLYVAYDDPDTKPWLGESFRFRIDGGYLQDLDDTQFIALKVTPGEDHVVDVDQVAWYGSTVGHAVLKEKFPAGAPTFVVAHIGTDGKPELANVGKDVGFYDVYHRLQACLCTKSFWDYF